MRKIVVFCFLSLALAKIAFGVCALEAPPLKERVKNVDAIFTGIVLRDDAVGPTNGWDREALVQVKNVFKGSPQEQVTIRYMSSKEGHCNGTELYPLSVGRGEEKIFYAKKRGESFFSSDKMGTRFTADQDVRKDIEILPAVVKETTGPWWDIFGWTKK